jgi:hypothetical protein
VIGISEEIFKDIPGFVKVFNFLLKISPVKINEKKSCPLRDGNHFGLT